MTNVVFTGKCIRSDEGLLTRPALTRIAGRAGFTVLNSVNSRVRYLVASRFDTRKARAAREVGVEVLSYAQFLAMCHDAIDSRTNVTASVARADAPLPLHDAGRMAPEEVLCAGIDFSTGAIPSKPPPRHPRKTAIGAGKMRRALDLD